MTKEKKLEELEKIKIQILNEIKEIELKIKYLDEKYEEIERKIQRIIKSDLK